MFHAKGGLYFERQVDGSVKVQVRCVSPGYNVVSWYDTRGTTPPPSEITFEVVLDPLTWASAVAAVSLRGNTVGVMEAALGLHEAAAPDYCRRYPVTPD